MPEFEPLASVPKPRTINPFGARLPMDCRVRGPECTGKVSQRMALVQLGEHPGKGHVWPRCRSCSERIDRNVTGIRRALAARQAAAESAVSEGWV